MAVPEKTLSASAELEGFLYADIGYQPNGLPVTVLTLLARAGVDPWAEAERLSHMPRPEAIASVANEINRAGVTERKPNDVGALAKDLVERLPVHQAVKPIDVTFAGTGFEGIPMMAFLMAVFAVMTFVLLAFIVVRG